MIKQVIVSKTHQVINVNQVEVKDKYLIINGTQKVAKNDKIVYNCCLCNKQTTQLFLYNKKFFEPCIKCGQCLLKETSLSKYGTENPMQNKAVKNKVKATNLQRYGVECSLHNPEIHKKVEQTWLRKYGVKNPSQAPEIIQKRTSTCLEKYDVMNPAQNEIIKHKIRQTNLKRYSAEMPFSSTKIQEKIAMTNFKKYGARFPLANKEIQEKVKETNLKKYGVENPLSSVTVRAKIVATSQKKYGTRNPAQSQLVKDKISDISRQKFLNSIFTGQRIVEAVPLFKPKDYSGIKTTLKWKCTKCNKVFEDNLIGGSNPRCPFCYPRSSRISNMELELADFLKTFKISLVTNSRSIIPPQEIDIYLSRYKIAIELDGLYWHSSLYKDKYYHLNKTQKCLHNNIKLIHIFEDEWIYKQAIVKSRLKAILGFNKNTIGARKTHIQEIDSKQKTLFLENYHLQGSDKANINLGAFYNTQLVAVMTFSKPRLALGQKKSNDNVYELTRYATIPDTSIPGAASKMLKYFIQHYYPVEIYSYADRRWSNGNLYKKIGFELVKETAPNYWYIANGQSIRQHRFKYRKSALKKFSNYNENKTEFQIMDEAGFWRIYDCGNLKFTKIIKK